MVRALDVLVDPKRFFAEADENPKARYPVLVVAAISLLGTVSFGVLLTTVLRNVDGGGAFVGVVVPIAFLTQLVGNLLVWVLYAGAFVALAGFVDGDGSFRTTLVFTGWGFLPRIVGAIVAGVASISGVSGVEPPTITLDDPAAVQQEVDRFATEATDPTLELVSALVGIALLLWSAYIWLHAVEEAQGLDRNQALIVVAIPVALAVLFRLSGLL